MTAFRYNDFDSGIKKYHRLSLFSFLLLTSNFSKYHLETENRVIGPDMC